MDNLFLNKLKTDSTKTEKAMGSLERKRTGSYYTSLELTSIMMEELVNEILASKRNIEDLTFFEPCVGSGNFVFSYLAEIEKLNLLHSQYESIFNNIYVCDINFNAINIYKQNLLTYAKDVFEITLSENYFENHIGNGLLVDLSKPDLTYVTLGNIFPNHKEGFDIVVTNPPYKNLKAEKTNYSHIEDYEADKQKYGKLFSILKQNFNYSLDGVLNLYKLFVEAIVDQYAKNDAFIDLLIPQTILSDKTSEKLRTHLLCELNIKSVKVIPENSGYIDAQQSLAAVLLIKSGTTKNIKVTKDFRKNPNQETLVSIKDIINTSTGNSIFALNDSEYETLKQIRKFPTVGELTFISNLRGELDLTINKKSITPEKTPYKLLRGRNVDLYKFTNSEEYVSPEFVNKSSKKEFISKERIICQQIVNINKAKRVIFSYIPTGYVLGNSCNFISVSKNEYNIDIYTLLGLFNCSIVNWYFKLTSSNNHINNYEIANFPIPTNSHLLGKISKLVQEYLKTSNEVLLDEIEHTAYLSYQTEYKEKSMVHVSIPLLTEFYKNIKYLLPELQESTASEILNGNLEIKDFLLQNGLQLSSLEEKSVIGIAEKYLKKSKNVVINHTTFKLSNLDMEMVKSVPQGGNWKNIPKETVAKSKRLERITQTGGRTTLYGRIDYKKPSYTITTYFNRPGNGTYIHPIHDRVLSVREASRFQCFKDDYYFYGNKSQILKQVGNAVPTLMAYQIAKSIVEKTKCKTSIDLFCGAGGMTAGFKEAGVKSVMANDIEESACITLKINNPEIPVLCGDITKREVKEKLITAARNYGADIICGGPPCQGFSLAGFRDENDPRNQLFRDFVELVKEIKPKIIVFENVEGLLSYQNGSVYNEILSLFKEFEYEAEGRTVMTNEYAVPQKRKRVIIICARKDLNISPKNLFPKRITTNEKNQISAFDTISDLENVQCSDNAVYSDAKESDIVQMFKSKISFAEYVERHTESAKEKVNNTEMLFDEDEMFDGD